MSTEYALLPRSAPEAQGVASSSLLAFVQAAEQHIQELHSFMLVRHGHVVAEGWWAPYASERPHMLYSLSKSFTATAAGLAAAEGCLSLDDRVLSFFPDEAPGVVSENLAAMRIRDLLTMSTGHGADTLGAVVRSQTGDWIRAFLEQPVDHAPGTHFVYNSGATYMVSAIVQKVTGSKVVEYLEPRLFAPLSISDATWESCPRGINTGGWGLNLKTEDIARFGLLYLQQGMWNGKRLLPEGWVAEATAKHISNGDDPNSDWNQGYGYQFWRSRYGAYRGDGAFGQFCVVMPDQDAVLAITAGTGNMQAELDVVWKQLLPAFKPDALPADSAGAEDLRRTLTGLALRTPPGEPSSPVAARVSGRTYHFEANEQNIQSITLAFDEEACRLHIQDAAGRHTLVGGKQGAWRHGETAFDNSTPRRCAASGAWTTNDTYTLKLCFTETPYCPTITCRFTEDRVTFDYKPNVSFGPMERPQLVGRTGIDGKL